MRSFNRISALAPSVLAMAMTMTVGFTAAQTSPPSHTQDSQVPASPGQGQISPGQSQGQSSPTQSTQTPRGQTNTPSAATEQPQQSGGQAGSVDQELQLTTEQKQQIASIVDDENQQISALRADTTMNDQQKMEKLQSIRATTGPKLRAVLTAEQLQKLAVIQQRQQQQQQQDQTTTQPAQPAPQK